MSSDVAAEGTRGVGQPRSAGDWFNLILAGSAAIVTLAMMLHVSINAAARSFFNSPVHGTLEYTQFWYLPIIAFVGIVTAQRNKEHIEARLLFDHLPPRTQPYVQIATDLLMLGLSVLIAFYSAQMALESMEIGRTAGVSGIVIWPATFAAPIGMALFVVWLAVDLVRSLRQILSGSTSDSAPEEA